MAKESIAVFIAANEVKQKLMAVKNWFDGPVRTEQDKLAQAVAKMCIDEVGKIKPADAAPVVHGRKAESAISKTGLMCTACYSDIDSDAVFCKYCGAKMDLN